MKRVLAADDDIGTRAVIKSTLGREFEVVAVENGKIALEMLQRDPNFACLLLDLDMPEMDGGETYRRLRQIPALADLPVIILTGDASVQTEAEALQAGVVTYFRKPFSPSQLLSIVKAATRNRS
ncbi:MAG: response regulator [Chloracidobacterium sp.]|nr:response regulator [Chloracidobacterium sp.]MDW8216342.1 response regulator [Acidobacteriota bacterium]